MASKCRVCGSGKLKSILDLGALALTGIFQKDGTAVRKAPLELVLCMGPCGLLQLAHSVPRTRVFGRNYGYESGINDSMRAHLCEITLKAQNEANPKFGDILLDIGSNDGTLLDFYDQRFRRVGIDPSAARHARNYDDKELIVGYFSRSAFKRKATIITSIACFYDLEDPMQFMRDIKASLAPDGIWVTEQSYMPAMLKNLAYDTICHEHIEYYGLQQIRWMADRVGLEIIDVSENDINGGSFCVTLAHRGSSFHKNAGAIESMLREERRMSLMDYRVFAERVVEHRKWLRAFLKDSRDRLILGYGASTKGNVLLQYCGVKLRAIADRNPMKWGLRTPGTNIPIISEEEARAMKPDYFLVLPWHFRKEIEERERAFTEAGGKLLFPLGAE